jgi:hypothetical protein
MIKVINFKKQKRRTTLIAMNKSMNAFVQVVAKILRFFGAFSKPLVLVVHLKEL